MVAKISYGSSLFGALAYNGEKVNEGGAKILETNKVFCSADGTHDIAACMQDFLAYMPSLIHTKKPIIHISLNPHPDDKITDEQFSARWTSYHLSLYPARLSTQSASLTMQILNGFMPKHITSSITSPKRVTRMEPKKSLKSWCSAR